MSPRLIDEKVYRMETQLDRIEQRLEVVDATPADGKPKPVFAGPRLRTVDASRLPTVRLFRQVRTSLVF
jgi:hypothetical protein